MAVVIQCRILEGMGVGFIVKLWVILLSETDRCNNEYDKYIKNQMIWPTYLIPLASSACFSQCTKNQSAKWRTIFPVAERLCTRHQLSMKISFTLVTLSLLSTQKIKKKGTHRPGPFATRCVVPSKLRTISQKQDANESNVVKTDLNLDCRTQLVRFTRWQTNRGNYLPMEAYYFVKYLEKQASLSLSDLPMTT